MSSAATINKNILGTQALPLRHLTDGRRKCSLAKDRRSPDTTRKESVIVVTRPQDDKRSSNNGPRKLLWHTFPALSKEKASETRYGWASQATMIKIAL